MDEKTAALILIVDDEPHNRKLLEVQLKHEGYLTASAASGAEALALVAQRAPDLILLDVMMPGMDGYELVRELKAGAHTANVPVIMMTALMGYTARMAALDAGAEEFLSKPVDRAELALRIRNLLLLKEYNDFLHEHNRRLEAEVKARSASIMKLNADLERRVLERTAELESVNRELDAFSYSVAHDLRSPLAAMTGFATLLARDAALKENPRAAHFVDRINAGAGEMSALIDGLLSLSHVSGSDVVREPVNLSDIATGLADDLRASTPGRDVWLEIQPDMMVDGDAVLLRQLLSNLLGNAWKFSSQKDQARIAVQRRPDASGVPVYVVQDNGAGFDMSDADRLFTPFQRLHTQTEFPGTGIGLATVHRIVTRHGGKIWAESAAGYGTTFHFTLA